MIGLGSVLLAAAVASSAPPEPAAAATLATPAQPTVADATTAGMLPVPPQEASGEVPLSRPIAPVPPGVSPWSLSLSVYTGVADPFYSKVASVLSVRRGFGQFALELFGGRAFSWSGPALGLCSSAASCSTPTSAQLASTPGDLGYMGGLGGVWRAAQGKASLAGLTPLNFSLELSLGAAGLQYAAGTANQSLFSVGGLVGLGLEMDLSASFGLRVDFQSIVYPTDIGSALSVENQLFAGVTASWLLGGPP